jgi:hypothetical protein
MNKIEIAWEKLKKAENKREAFLDIVKYVLRKKRKVG